jgi:hypothetical protein
LCPYESTHAISLSLAHTDKQTHTHTQMHRAALTAAGVLRRTLEALWRRLGRAIAPADAPPPMPLLPARAPPRMACSAESDAEPAKSGLWGGGVPGTCRRLSADALPTGEPDMAARAHRTVRQPQRCACVRARSHANCWLLEDSRTWTKSRAACGRCCGLGWLRWRWRRRACARTRLALPFAMCRRRRHRHVVVPHPLTCTRAHALTLSHACVWARVGHTHPG